MKKFEWKTVKHKIGKGKKRLIAVTMVLCLVAATVGNAISKQGKTKAEDSKAINTTVKTGTIQESVSGTGTISYASSTDIEVPSDLEINEVLVSEGTYVEQGDKLATVDATSLAVCIADIEDEISSLDDTITSELSSTTTKYITAGVSGTVEDIYGKEGDSVADVMVEHGALMLVKNGDETIKVIGSDGTITSVNVSEGGTVSSSTKVYTLESDAQSGDYLQAVKDREELVSLLETLISIKQNGGITAGVEGMIETVNVSGSTSNSTSGTNSGDSAAVSSTGTASGGSADVSSAGTASGDLADVSSAGTASGDSADVSSTGTASGGSEAVSSAGSASGDVHIITAVRMTNLSAGDVSTSGVVTAYGISEEKQETLKALKAGTGRIEGTTSDMEYAAGKDADEWIACTDNYTEVTAGTWYVRYKASDSNNASEAVEIEVTDASAADNTSSDVSDSSKNSSTKGTTGDTGNTDNSGESSKSGSTGSDQTESKGNADSSSSSSTDSSKNSGSSSSSGSGDTGQGSKNSDSSNGSTGSKSNGSKSSGSSGSTGSKSSSSGSGSSGSGSSGSGSANSASGNSLGTISTFTIADGDKMKVTMNVDELDIITMEKGLSAEITLDAVEGKTFEGTITNVSGSANSSNGTAQYPVEITFDKTEEMLSGMNASVDVIVSEAKDVLTIPLAAVSDEGRSSYVYTGYDESSGELTGKTEVTLGMSNDNSVEVTEGLSEGDIIYYEMKSSESSDNKSGRNGMGGMGMPGMNGSGDMKMGGDRPSGGNGGEHSSGGNGGDRPTGGNGQGRSKGN